MRWRLKKCKNLQKWEVVGVWNCHEKCGVSVGSLWRVSRECMERRYNTPDQGSTSKGKKQKCIIPGNKIDVIDNLLRGLLVLYSMCANNCLSMPYTFWYLSAIVLLLFNMISIISHFYYCKGYILWTSLFTSGSWNKQYVWFINCFMCISQYVAPYQAYDWCPVNVISGMTDCMWYINLTLIRFYKNWSSKVTSFI